jgi:ABC-type multidrug transport system fused ATPase/permease subunit
MLVYSLVHRWWARLAIISLSFLATVLGLSSPLFQKIFVDRLSSAPLMIHGVPGLTWMETVSPMILIVCAFAVTLLQQTLNLCAGYFSTYEGVLLQQEFSNRLYRKMLSIRSDAMGSTTIGEVVAIFATDVAGSTGLIDQAIPMGAGILFPLVVAPIAIHWMCGIPMWATTATMVVIIAMNLLMALRQSRFFYLFKQLAAERVGMVNEWVQNIRLLRVLGWVDNYEAKIFSKREEETVNRIGMVTNGQMMNAIGSSISFAINLIGISSLLLLRGDSVTGGDLFALLWIFGVFLLRPFRMFPWLFTMGFDALSSLRRLERFMAKDSDPIDHHEEVRSGDVPVKPAPAEVRVRGLNLRVNGVPLLRDIDFTVAPGEFVAIVGEVGCGKSLLMLSLVAETGATFDEFKIGEIDALKLDFTERRRHFAFVPQEGFVMSATLRENLFFHYRDRHDDHVTSDDDAVINSLQLAQFKLVDEQVADGLNTEIGERGVNLSGGQRQRVSLARAHSFKRSVILLDDCLSAVDVDTEDLLIKDLIGGDWKDRTRLLVTHRLSVLTRVDRIFFMETGRIVETGTFDELLQRSGRMRKFVATVQKQTQAKTQLEPEISNESMSDMNIENTGVIDVAVEVSDTASKANGRSDGETEVIS